VKAADEVVAPEDEFSIDCTMDLNNAYPARCAVCKVDPNVIDGE